MALDSSCNKSICASQMSGKHQGICPSGWHIPTIAEWDDLVAAAGGSSTAGKKLKATSGWSYNGQPANGEDAFEFAALPGGIGYSSGGFSSVGTIGSWWSAHGSGTNNAYRQLIGGSEYVDAMIWDNYSKRGLLSVRCVQD